MDNLWQKTQNEDNQSHKCKFITIDNTDMDNLWQKTQNEDNQSHKCKFITIDNTETWTIFGKRHRMKTIKAINVSL